MISADGDFATHVLHGQTILSTGALLPEEPSTLLTPGRPLIAHEWLSQVAFGVAENLAGGPEGPVLLVAALLAWVFCLTLIAASREAGVWPALLALGLALLVGRLHMLARPHVFTWLLGIVFCQGLIRLQRGDVNWRRWLAGSIPLIVLWVNLHGGFALAFFLLGLFGLSRLVEAARSQRAARGRASLAFGQLFGSGLLLLGASGLNPSGFQLHAHILTHLQSPELVFQREFLPPDWAAPEHLPSLVLIAVLGLVLFMGRKRPERWEWALALGMVLVSLRSARNLPLLAIFCAPLIAGRLQGLLDQGSQNWAAALNASSERLAALEQQHGGGLSTALAALVVALCVGVAKAPPLHFDPEQLPVEAVAWVRAQPSLDGEDVLASYHWGGYVGRVLSPRRTLVNGLADHFGVDAMNAFERIRQAEPGWEEALRDFGIHLAIYDVNTPLCEALERSPRWREIHQAGPAKVFFDGER
jgi:hypothetical protein